MSVDASALLHIIAGRDMEGLIEIRCRRPRDGKIVHRAWFTLRHRVELLRVAEANAPNLDVYVGVAPRCRRGGKKSDVQRAWCLWVDCDTPESLERLKVFSPRPSMIIRSGSGTNRHAYWALSRPLSPAWIERANRRLSHELRSNVSSDGHRNSVEDIARVMRLPGTLNHKHDRPRRVTVERFNEVRFPVASVVKNLRDPPTKPPRVPRSDVRADDPLLGISADRYYAALTGRPVTNGNVQCPFLSHNDGRERKPSMCLYATTFYCFGCGVGGSVYQFASRLWGLGTRGEEFKRLRERLAEVLL